MAPERKGAIDEDLKEVDAREETGVIVWNGIVNTCSVSSGASHSICFHLRRS